MYFPTNVYAQPNPAQTVQPVASRGSQNKLLILNVCLSIPVAMPSKAYICGICDELIARAGDSHLSCMCLIVCGIETSNMRRPKMMQELGRCAQRKGNLITCQLYELFCVYIGRRASVWPLHLRFKMILTPSP